MFSWLWKQSDLSMVMMVFDFISIMKHVQRKKFLFLVKVVFNKYLRLLDFVFYMFFEILE